ncbi:hypothetical protein HNR44_001545 [Geomicrobium halophilum]|uniref:Replication-relaxation n=1 Tax=Geomicrobium halophilum TaxID=549000 RepID=A0A841PQZ1_9BACL|nr:hypothetical protein [Geomicrobium halophilum]
MLTRDQLVALHFRGLRQPVKNCNFVMKRLRRDGEVKALTDGKQYVYMPAGSTIKKGSTKIPHFLRIADFYQELCEIERPQRFKVEPKIGEKGTVEPDIFMIWKQAPFFVELQRTTYGQRVFNEKMARYDHYYHGGEWKRSDWQPSGESLFPNVWIITSHRYEVSGDKRRSYQVLQTARVRELFG